MDIVVRERGEGPALLLIHGSAADHSTWNVQLAALKGTFRLLSYDRRLDIACDVAGHARDAADLIAAEVGHACAVVGSSFGAVVAMELARRHSQWVSRLFLCEPPLAPSDYCSAIPPGFGCQFDAISASQGGPAAAEFFLRTVLGDAAFERMPRAFQDRTRAASGQIRADMSALARYKVDYSQLASQISCPVFLLGGDRSADFYAETLDALEAALPNSQRVLLKGAGHMMHVEAHKQFNELLQRECSG